MGMSGCFAAADAATLERLRASPDEIEAFLFPDDGDGEPEHGACVDKAWHGIHFVLAGDADYVDTPAGWAIMGGREIGDDMGYGPARWLPPEQVRLIAAALPDVDAFSAAYDPEAMTRDGVYPDVIWLRDGDDARDYLVENYALLLTFYREAAARGDGVFLWIC
jgi:hypothetical protein